MMKFANICPFRYGELQGLNKQETADRYGKEQVHEWRRSYDTPPPNGESLEMCAERAVAYFREQVGCFFFPPLHIHDFIEAIISTNMFSLFLFLSNAHFDVLHIMSS